MGIPLSGGTGWGPGENCCLFTLTNSDKNVIRQVSCEGENVVSVTWSDDTRIKFVDKAFRDSLPALRSLRIERCLAITTTFPDWMTNWPNLQELHLASNKFTGIMPQDLRGMTNLKVLDLYGNQLTGPIPTVPSKLDVCKFDNNNVCVYADAVFPSSMSLPCNRNIPTCPQRTSGATATATISSGSGGATATGTTTATYVPNSPVPSPSNKWRFTGCLPLNTSTYPDADSVCKAKHDSTYAGQWLLDKTPSGDNCPDKLSGVWCLVDDNIAPQATLTTILMPMPTDGPYFPPEATPLAVADSTLLSLSAASSFGPSGLLCSTTSCSMSPTSAGQYRVMCPPEEHSCSVFLLIDTGTGQDGCLSVLKDWSDPAVVPCAAVKRMRNANGTSRGYLQVKAVEGGDITGLTGRQFTNMSELIYYPFWSLYNISSARAHAPAVSSITPPTNVTKIYSAHLSNACLVLPNASRPLGAVTIGDCDDGGSDSWNIGGLPSNGAPPAKPPAQAQGPNIGMIVGITVGVVAALAIAGLATWYFVRNKKRNSPDSPKSPKNRAPSVADSDNDIKAVLGPDEKGSAKSNAVTTTSGIPAAQPNGSETMLFNDSASLDTDASSILSRKTYGSTLSSSFSLTSSVDPSRESYPYGYNYYNRPPETKITSSLLDSSRVVDRTGREVRPKHMEVMPRIPPPSPTLNPRPIGIDMAAASRAAAGGPPSPRTPPIPGSPIAGSPVASSSRTAVPTADAMSTKSGRSGRSGRSKTTSAVVPAASPNAAATPAVSEVIMPAPSSPQVSPIVLPTVAAATMAVSSSPLASPTGPESPVTPTNKYYQFINPDKVFRVIKPYRSVEDDELSIEVGGYVRVEMAYRDGWGLCYAWDRETGLEGKKGMTPLGFLDPVGISKASFGKEVVMDVIAESPKVEATA